MPISLLGTALMLAGVSPSPVRASPDGADWTIAETPDGCRSCHLGEPAASDSTALSIEGLPKNPQAGRRYDLTVVLEDPALRYAGFLLSTSSGDGPAGAVESIDEQTEASGASARSTWEGTFPGQPGRASWRLIWTAPDEIPGMIRVSLWGNAGNDDLSPLGDRPYHRTWQIPAAP